MLYIIHYVYRVDGEWMVAYEKTGEWRPTNTPLKQLLDFKDY